MALLAQTRHCSFVVAHVDSCSLPPRILLSAPLEQATCPKTAQPKDCARSFGEHSGFIYTANADFWLREDSWRRTYRNFLWEMPLGFGSGPSPGIYFSAFPRFQTMGTTPEPQRNSTVKRSYSQRQRSVRCDEGLSRCSCVAFRQHLTCLYFCRYLPPLPPPASPSLPPSLPPSSSVSRPMYCTPIDRVLRAHHTFIRPPQWFIIPLASSRTLFRPVRGEVTCVRVMQQVGGSKGVKTTTRMKTWKTFFEIVVRVHRLRIQWIVHHPTICKVGWPVRQRRPELTAGLHWSRQDNGFRESSGSGGCTLGSRRGVTYTPAPFPPPFGSEKIRSGTIKLGFRLRPRCSSAEPRSTSAQGASPPHVLSLREEIALHNFLDCPRCLRAVGRWDQTAAREVITNEVVPHCRECSLL